LRVVLYRPEALSTVLGTEIAVLSSGLRQIEEAIAMHSSRTIPGICSYPTGTYVREAGFADCFFLGAELDSAHKEDAVRVRFRCNM
jgi:hypothetical protein